MKLKWHVIAFCGVAALATGCSQLGYFMQAAQGQFSLMAEAKPIDDWLANPNTDDKVKHKLAKVKKMRAFAAKELGLPDNRSYTTYADLPRPYVLWNVVATPELSLKPKQWCFPVAGCVNYRGYYNKAEAQAYAAELRRANYDVDVSGVPAYSTLGWFSDPVLSTFIQYPDAQLARLIFHELAHQVVYTSDDSKFNESFAVAVEEAGVQRWLAKYGDENMRKAYADYEKRKRDFLALLMKYRNALDENYKGNVTDDEKRRKKAELFQAMKDEYQTLKVSWGGYGGYDRWFAEPLSNAHLAIIATYHDLVPGFRAILVQQKSLDQFYVAARKLAVLNKTERHRQLAELGKNYQPVVPSAIAAANQ